jgi:hypothetical protein
MKMVMSTCNRQPSYVQASLASLYEADPSAPPIELSVSGLDATFLGPWLSDGRVARIDLFTPDQADMLGRLRPKARAAYALRVALERVEGPVLTLEDDIVFAPDWYRTLCATLERMLGQDQLTESWVMLALYSPHVHHEKPYERYPKRGFYGSQGLLIGADVRRGIVAALAGEDRLGDQRTRGGDMIIQEYIGPTVEVGLYAMNPSVIQHVGRASAIGSQWHHESPTFGKEHE